MSSYVRLIRFHYHVTFAGVVFGALFTAKAASYTLLFVSLLGLYLSFNVLLYGGIYTLNAIVDRDSDRNHPTKRFRPLPSGEFSVRSALVFAVLMTGAGLATALMFFNSSIFRCFVIFAVINVAYSTVAKKIPYIEIIVNSATHPLRFVMGASLTQGKIPLGLLLALFLLAFGVAVTRRCVERTLDGWRARKVLERYSTRSLFSLRLGAFAVILLVATIDSSIPPIVYRCLLSFYCVFVFGFELLPPLRSVFVKLWTR